MPISLSKLERLLIDNSFVISSFYIVEGICEYMKTFSIISGETLIIKIPREFNFTIKSQEMINRGNDVFNLSRVIFDDKEDDKNKVEKLKEYPHEREFEEKYLLDLDINKNIDNKKDLEEELEKNYKVSKIYLRDLEKNEILSLKDCQRQMKRLQHSVQELNYNICIVEDNYFLPEDKCFIVKTQKTEGKRLLFILVDIETFHENIKNLIDDVISIKKGMYKILDKNSEINSTNLFLVLEKFEKIEDTLENIVKKKNELHSYIQEYRELLEKLSEEEKEVVKELDNLTEKRTDFFSDSHYVHKKSKLENKMLSLQNTKQKLLKSLNSAFQDCDNTYLKTDKCEFDIAIFLDDIYKNLKVLKEELN